MKNKERIYSSYTQDASLLLGRYIQIARKSRKMTEIDFADRVGISRSTLQKIEKGDPKCEIGIVLEAAVIAGVKLFESSNENSFAQKLDSAKDKLTLLPKSIRESREVDDEF